MKDEGIESSLEEKDLRGLVDENLDVTRQCVLGKPTVSWAASKAVCPAGQGRSFCPSAPLW